MRGKGTMNKINKEAVIEYFECDCHDEEHILRAWWDDELNSISFQFKLSKYPTTWKYITKPHDWLKISKWNSFHGWLYRVGQYFKTIWWAIKGKPVWFWGYNDLSRREMKRLVKFMNYCLGRNKKK